MSECTLRNNITNGMGGLLDEIGVLFVVDGTSIRTKHLFDERTNVHMYGCSKVGKEDVNLDSTDKYMCASCD